MAWTAPKINFNSNDGLGFADVNKINANLTYLREDNKTINGTNTFTGNITQTSGVTSLKTTTISGDLIFNNSQHFIYSDTVTTTGAVIEMRGSSLGTNPSSINLKSNNVNMAQFQETAIRLLKPVTITGHLDVSSYGLFGGAVYDSIHNLNVIGSGLFSGDLTADNLTIVDKITPRFALYPSTATTEGALWSALNAWITTIGNSLPCSGWYNRVSSGGIKGFIQGIKKTGAPTIEITTTGGTEILTQGSVVVVSSVGIESNWGEFT